MNVIVRFRGEEEAIEWFLAAREDGVFALNSGLRRADGLDGPQRGAQGLIVSSDPGIGGWIVEPAEAGASDALVSD